MRWFHGNSRPDGRTFRRPDCGCDGGPFGGSDYGPLGGTVSRSVGGIGRAIRIGRPVGRSVGGIGRSVGGIGRSIDRNRRSEGGRPQQDARVLAVGFRERDPQSH